MSLVPVCVCPQVKDGVAEDAAQKMLDDFWSLQYLVPAGILNAFAGAMKPGIQNSHVISCDLTHALHLRFSTTQVRLTSTFISLSGTETDYH